MVRNYEPKGNTRDREVERKLKELRESKGDDDGAVRGFPLPVIPGDDFEPSFKRLSQWLDAGKNDPDLYSALIQVWLWQQGITWPEGVFEMNLDSIGSGRKSSGAYKLGRDALRRYKRNEVGYQQVARDLIPEKWKANPEAAAAEIQRAIKTYLADKATKLIHLERIAGAIGNEMLGINRDENEEAFHDQWIALQREIDPKDDDTDIS